METRRTLRDPRSGSLFFTSENEDSQLNTNFLGIPKEGIGFSNHPPIWKGGPDYEAMTFVFSFEQTTIAIKINYLI